MTKKQFLDDLSKTLKGFAQSETRSVFEYYNEIIDDKIEVGLSEEEAVESLGNPKNIAARITSELIFKRAEKGENKLNNTRLLIVALCFSPILFPLGIAFIAIVFSIIITIGALSLSFALASIAAMLSIGLSTVSLIANGFSFFIITLYTGVLVTIAGVFGMLAVLSFKLLRSIMLIITMRFSKRANKKLADNAASQ